MKISRTHDVNAPAEQETADAGAVANLSEPAPPSPEDALSAPGVAVKDSWRSLAEANETLRSSRVFLKQQGRTLGRQSNLYRTWISLCLIEAHEARENARMAVRRSLEALATKSVCAMKGVLREAFRLLKVLEVAMAKEERTRKSKDRFITKVLMPRAHNQSDREAREEMLKDLRAALDASEAAEEKMKKVLEDLTKTAEKPLDVPKETAEDAKGQDLASHAGEGSAIRDWEDSETLEGIEAARYMWLISEAQRRAPPELWTAQREVEWMWKVRNARLNTTIEAILDKRDMLLSVKQFTHKISVAVFKQLRESVEKRKALQAQIDKKLKKTRTAQK